MLIPAPSNAAIPWIERFGRDQGEWDRLAEAYVDDSWVRTTWFEGTGREFAEASRVMAERGRHSRHPTVPIWARAVAAKDTITAVNPRDEISLDWDVLGALRPSYRIWAYMMGLRGHEVSQEKIGDDRPDLLRAFYAHANHWLATDENRDLGVQ